MYILGVTSCPVGIAHTYMAAEKLAEEAKKMSIGIKVETRGSVGIENKLTEQEIAEADVVILAVDVKISGEERFKGKPVIRVGTAAVIKNAIGFIEKVEKAMENKG